MFTYLLLVEFFFYTLLFEQFHNKSGEKTIIYSNSKIKMWSMIEMSFWTTKDISEFFSSFFFTRSRKLNLIFELSIKNYITSNFLNFRPRKIVQKNKVKVWLVTFLEDLRVYTLFDVFFDCIIENRRSTTYSNRKSMQKNNINKKNHSILFLCHHDPCQLQNCSL